MKQKQDLWFCEMSEQNIGLTRAKVFGKPIKKRYTVSWGTGDMVYESNGINLDYDRQITSFERRFNPKEGWYVFVDRVPALDENGYLALREDNVTPVTYPDYIIVKIIDTAKGMNARYCVKKV